ncbi:putative ATP binding protein [Cardiosporidium cionae]|uniref:GPN-loop GTPase 2 n=1 Tax=Cardiosporidium cionae TaxID=476202 RepID=A0ABQ7J8W5_9APIC|nr:putative ATP binding protein [Cardiosporidium cionae]|eukprot:KAF8820410.1 putative ATP binding protein [Cardiosporidium cionae]
MWYGQFVIGPPGAGKTTYCHGMQQMFTALNRKHAIINLDPANDELPYKCFIDIRNLINSQNVMESMQLGPNGDTYIVFDCPGQVELYCHHTGMKTILDNLQKQDARMAAVHLVDSTLCTDPYKYISALLISLSGQISLELPHVNVFTKIDMLQNFSRDLTFRIDYYAEVQDLSKLISYMQQSSPLNSRFSAFNELLCETIEDFNLVAFRLLNIEDKDSVLNVLKEVDTANGFALGSIHSDLGIFNIAISSVDDIDDRFGSIHERYIDVEESNNENVEEKPSLSESKRIL